jgi:hypothetical protein
MSVVFIPEKYHQPTLLQWNFLCLYTLVKKCLLPMSFSEMFSVYNPIGKCPLPYPPSEKCSLPIHPCRALSSTNAPVVKHPPSSPFVNVFSAYSPVFKRALLTGRVLKVCSAYTPALNYTLSTPWFRNVLWLQLCTEMSPATTLYQYICMCPVYTSV